MTAPDRIWATEPSEAFYEDQLWFDTPGGVNLTEYIRRDPAVLARDETVLAMVGAVIEEAARKGVDAAVDYWTESAKPVSERKHGGSGLPGCVMKEILALTPADAAAALAARDKRIRDEALEDAAQLAYEVFNDPDALAAAILGLTAP